MNDHHERPRNPGLKAVASAYEERWGQLIHGDDWPKVRDEIRAEQVKAKRRRESLPVKVTAGVLFAVIVSLLLTVVLAVLLGAFLFLRLLVGWL